MRILSIRLILIAALVTTFSCKDDSVDNESESLLQARASRGSKKLKDKFHCSITPVQDGVAFAKQLYFCDSSDKYQNDYKYASITDSSNVWNLSVQLRNPEVTVVVTAIGEQSSFLKSKYDMGKLGDRFSVEFQGMKLMCKLDLNECGADKSLKQMGIQGENFETVSFDAIEKSYWDDVQVKRQKLVENIVKQSGILVPGHDERDGE